MSSDKQRQFSGRPSNKVSLDADGGKDMLRQPSGPSEAEPPVYAEEPAAEKKEKTRADKKLKVTGLVLAGLFAISMFFMPTSSSVNTSGEAAQALENHVSTQLPVGARILSDDEYLAGQDVTITHSSPSSAA